MSIENASFLKPNENTFATIVITGVCRSGKTTLGNILATCKEVEYADEPYTTMLLPMVAKSGKIDQEFASRWMSSHLSELFNDLLLLRAANFRPNDLSSIWTKKHPKEIAERLTRLNTRAEAYDFSKQNNSQLVVTLSECIPFMDFIYQSIPRLKVIHIIRDPYQVAKDVENKQWFSDAQLHKPLMAQLYHSFHYADKQWHLPWWVNNEEQEYFLNLNEYERGLYYWWSLMDKGLDAFDSLQCDKIAIYYEDIIKEPKSVLENLINSLNFTTTELTDSKINTIKSNPISIVEMDTIDPTIRQRISLIKEKMSNGNSRRH